VVATDLPGVKVVRQVAALVESIKIVMDRDYNRCSPSHWESNKAFHLLVSEFAVRLSA
jgi:hypothetical protein